LTTEDGQLHGKGRRPFEKAESRKGGKASFLEKVEGPRRARCCEVLKSESATSRHHGSEVRAQMLHRGTRSGGGQSLPEEGNLPEGATLTYLQRKKPQKPPSMLESGRQSQDAFSKNFVVRTNRMAGWGGGETWREILDVLLGQLGNAPGGRPQLSCNSTRNILR